MNNVRLAAVVLLLAILGTFVIIRQRDKISEATVEIARLQTSLIAKEASLDKEVVELKKSTSGSYTWTQARLGKIEDHLKAIDGTTFERPDSRFYGLTGGTIGNLTVRIERLEDRPSPNPLLDRSGERFDKVEARLNQVGRDISSLKSDLFSLKR